jgi:hypothetical protein
LNGRLRVVSPTLFGKLAETCNLINIGSYVN